jgi:hypothetical protein
MDVDAHHDVLGHENFFSFLFVIATGNFYSQFKTEICKDFKDDCWYLGIFVITTH